MNKYCHWCMYRKLNHTVHKHWSMPNNNRVNGRNLMKFEWWQYWRNLYSPEQSTIQSSDSSTNTEYYQYITNTFTFRINNSVRTNIRTAISRRHPSYIKKISSQIKHFSKVAHREKPFPLINKDYQFKYAEFYFTYWRRFRWSAQMIE